MHEANLSNDFLLKSGDGPREECRGFALRSFLQADIKHE
jgi:hypothetical protein